MPATGPEKATADVAAPLQSVWSAVGATEGVGFTVMVKSSLAPVQLLAEGVTVTVAVSMATPVLVAEKEVISPVPERASPMLLFVFVHE